jgi:hypothetical protein
MGAQGERPRQCQCPESLLVRQPGLEMGLFTSPAGLTPPEGLILSWSANRPSKAGKSLISFGAQYGGQHDELHLRQRGGA